MASMGLLPHADNVLASDAVSYPLRLSWDEPWESPINVADQVHKDGVAGSEGHVIAKEGHLFFEQGSRARFWGVGLTLSDTSNNPFPPQKKYSAGFARRLAKYGINHVRIVGFDNSLRGIVSGWLKSGKLESDYLDRFDYLISKLREQGIYYSFSINNSSLYLFDDLANGPVNNYREPWRRYRHIRLFYPAYVQRQVDWYKALFGHRNRYTGLTYAEDPANVYVAAVNEDSIFYAYFKDFRSLTSANRSFLEAQFSRYLKSKYRNQSALERSWCGEALHSGESLTDGAITVQLPAQLRTACAKRRVDTLGFLMSIDEGFATRVYTALKEIGYRGLFAGTNNWYGYGAMWAQMGVSTYTDVHGYFDHPVNKKISGKSFLNHLDDPELYKDFSFPFTKSIIQAVQGRPVVVSEWNHAAWSRYAYEGPILVTVYGSLQGYVGLDAHTWFSYPDSDLMSRVPKNAFAVGTNPIFMALSPSLSVAFVNGYIRESQEVTVLPLVKNEREFYDLILDCGLSRQLGKDRYPFTLLFERKIRTVLFGDDIKLEHPVVGHRAKRSIVSTTGEIKWTGKAVSGGRLTVDSTHFKALVTGEAAVQRLADVEISAKGNGAITIVSLDGKPIKVSRKLLLTAVSGLYMEGDRSSFRRPKSASAPWLQRLKGRVRLHHNTVAEGRIRASAVYTDGSRNPLEVRYERGVIGKDEWWTVNLGELDSPWVLLEVD